MRGDWSPLVGRWERGAHPLHISTSLSMESVPEQLPPLHLRFKCWCTAAGELSERTVLVVSIAGGADLEVAMCGVDLSMSPTRLSNARHAEVGRLSQR